MIEYHDLAQTSAPFSIISFVFSSMQRLKVSSAAMPSSATYLRTSSVIRIEQECLLLVQLPITNLEL